MHLFLEGPIRTGKSTVIRQCIAPYMEQGNDLIGGFSCQRLWENNEPRGYRMTCAHDLELDAPFDENASDIFLDHGKGKTKKNLSVFESSAIDFLDAAKGCRLILLDEIGGIDLLVPAFRKKLYEVLAGPVPCIGVLKSNNNALHVGKKSASAETVSYHNQQLRRDLAEQFHAQILYFTRENADGIRAQIDTFLQSCLGKY